MATLYMLTETSKFMMSFVIVTEHLRRIGRIRMYGTALTRRWMDLLGDEKHYVTADGTQVIPL